MVRIDLTSNNIVDITLAHLLLNIKQKIIMCEIICYTIYNHVTFRFKQSA